MTADTIFKHHAEWLEMLAKTLHDGRYKYRVSRHRPTIEIRSKTAPKWLPKLLPDGGVEFATKTDRNRVFNALRAKGKTS